MFSQNKFYGAAVEKADVTSTATDLSYTGSLRYRTLSYLSSSVQFGEGKMLSILSNSLNIIWSGNMNV